MIITRFAPAPTGKLHIGSARTTLFNYLFAKKNKGLFILRIEDTDIKRSGLEYEKDIMESLKWLGIEWDEGPASISQEEIEEIPNSPEGKPSSSYEAGKFQIPNYRKNYIGDRGPYRQSERLDIYTKYLKKLLEEDKVYYCFCSEEELEAQRQHQLSISEAPRYSGKCANLSKEEVQKLLSQGKPAVIRFRVLTKKIEFNDLIRGKLEFDISLMGDIIIAKNINTPLYNFACVVDDFEMKISHVIRGEEHIPNTPKQILIQKALGFSTPKYAHLPLILGRDRSKMSKRDGAVSIISYKEDGYLPEALINFIAFLGWNPKDKREFFTIEELIKEFSIEKVQKSGAIFNIEKLDYINGYYIRKKSVSELTELCLPYLIESGLIVFVSDQKYKNLDSFGNKNLDSSGNKNLIPYGIGKNLEFFRFAQKYQKKNGEIVDLEYIKKVISIYQERLKKLSEISELTDYFFKDKLEYKKEMFIWKDMTYDKVIKSLLFTKNVICDKIKDRDGDNNFNQNRLKKVIIGAILNFNKSINLPPELIENKGFVLWPFRVALTAKEASSGPFEIAEILGKEEVIKRIDQAVSFLVKN